ncbi:MAG: hypothetical protein HYS12_26040, partial [Planctomycetes bacterium]|nr:hypothetical protein [Planctomycetota bacterium]
MRSLAARPLGIMLAVLILLGVGAVWVGAARPVKADQPGKPFADGKGDKKPDQKKFKFTVAGEKWDAVFRWLKEETGKPVIAQIKPTGTCSVLIPEKAEYTLPETIDLINQALIDQKYILVQRENSFALVPADEKIDAILVMPEELKNLDKHGNTEVVRVTLPVKGINVEDIQADIQRMLSKFGDVVVFPRVNQLVITDTVATIRLVERSLREMAGEGNAETLSHTCKFIKARDAEKVLKDLLGDPAKLLAAQAQQGGPPGFRPQAPPPALPKKMHYITSDESKNMVLVTGPADIIAKAKEIIKEIDKGGPGAKEIKPGDPKLVSFEVPTGKAEAIAKPLQDKYKDANSVRISTAGSTILVYAYPDDLMDITKLIKDVTEGGSETKLIPINNGDATKIADTLKGMFGEPKDPKDSKTGAGGPFIEAQPDQNSIAVHGTSEQVKRAVKAIGVITGEDPTGTGIGGGEPSKMRVITLDQGSAASLADALERMLKQMRKNPVNVISPSREPPKEEPPKPKEEKPKSDKDKKPDERKTSLDNQTDLDASQRRPGEMFVAQLTDPKKDGDEDKRKDLPGTDKPVNITAFGNRLIITSDDPQALKLAYELVQLIIRTKVTEGDFKVIKLKYANAAEAARVLDEAFNGPRQQQRGGGGGFGFGGGGFGFGGGQFGQFGARPPAQPQQDRIRVVADQAANTLLIRATPLDMLTIQRLLADAIDDPSSTPLIQTHWIHLKYATAGEVATVLRDVYREQMGDNPQRTTVGGFGGFAFPGFGGGGLGGRRNLDSNGNARQVTLTLGVDEHSNNLILSCSEAMKKDIEKVVEYMEKGAEKSTRVVKLVPLNGVDPYIVQQAIDAIQGRRSTFRSSNGTSGNSTTPGFVPFGSGGLV